MSARHPLALLAAGLVVTVATAACATTVTGSPRAATTVESSPTTTAPSTPTPTSNTPTPTTISSTPAQSSGIRPFPPLSTDTTDTTTTTTASSASGSPTATDPGSVAGIDLSAVLHQLDATHVASVDSKADLAKLTAVVDRARASGLKLSVVSIGRTISNDDTSAISRQLFATVKGTLVVLSPTLISARTDQLTDSQRDAAINAAAKGKNDVESVTNFVASALESAGLATTPPAKPSTTAPTTHPTVNGVDIDAIVKELGPDHIAIGSGMKGVTAQQLQPEVDKAWKAKLKVYVALLAKDPSGHLYDVSSAVMDVTGGTVIAISPKRYAISSKTVKDDVLNKALDSAAKADTYQAMVTKIIDTLLKG